MSFRPGESLTTSTGTAAVTGTWVSVAGADEIAVVVKAATTAVASVTFLGRMEDSNTDTVIMNYRPYTSLTDVDGGTAYELTTADYQVFKILDPTINELAVQLSTYTSGAVEATVYPKLKQNR